MDIRDWPLDRIMQLPDSCFGTRWPVIFSGTADGAAIDFYISESGLPDRCVLWEMSVTSWFKDQYLFTCTPLISLALGDQLPALDAQFLAMENMFPEADEMQANNRVIRGSINLTMLRKPYMAQGRRVVLRIETASPGAYYFYVGLVFSSIPTEVPDCLISV